MVEPATSVKTSLRFIHSRDVFFKPLALNLMIKTKCLTPQPQLLPQPKLDSNLNPKTKT